MTRERIEELRKGQEGSGKSMKDYLREMGVSSYSYYHWCKKYSEEASAEGMLSPVAIRHAGPVSSRSLQCSHDVVTIIFPNGIQCRFGSGSEEVLSELFTKILGSHVLP